MGRKSGKRQASVDARKQILKVRGDFLELSDDDGNDEDVIEISDSQTPKKYKVSQRRSDGERNVLCFTRLDTEPTLELDVWTDDLSPAQLAMRKNAQSARESVQQVVDNVVKHYNGRLLLEETHLAAVEVAAYVQAQSSKAQTQRAGPGRPSSKSRQLPAHPSQPKGLYPHFAPSGRPGLSPSLVTKRKSPGWRGYQAAIQPPSLVPIIRTDLPTQPTVSTSIVDLTQDDTGCSADTKEVTFNRLQGKTFPSLVVVARPSLNSTVDLSDDHRKLLDRKVKKLLMHSPALFVEYLIQQGLVKSEHYCASHWGSRLKLGMYKDAARFPFSGGYIWVSDCCPLKFLSVFHDSLFDGNYSPSSIYKLIYHWACQTSAQNIALWVNVENIFLKGFFTWLRAICTTALHTHMEPLGGKGVCVEIGVISLGTTTPDGSNRHVKVEVLGVLDTSTRKLLLKAIDPSDYDCHPNKNAKKRFSMILEPLLDWVNQDSTLVVDMTIDIQSLQSIGFNNFQRSNPNGLNNHMMMDYLRRVVPRMFQNTLSLLSRQIIQQFLDELVWREMYGNNPLDTFNNILKNIAEQTKVNTRTPLIQRLNKIALNPFKNCSLSQYIKDKSKKPQQRPTDFSLEQKVSLVSGAEPTLGKPKLPKVVTSLEPYYYGTIDCVQPPANLSDIIMQCPKCSDTLTDNISAMTHLFAHLSNSEHFCSYCLTDCGTPANSHLLSHMESHHPSETKTGSLLVCLICHVKFTSVEELGKHMSLAHCPSELPYHCGACSFKSSNHKLLVDHFRNVHARQTSFLCPLCLNVEQSHTEHDISDAVKSYLGHMEEHFVEGSEQNNVHKCQRCILQFTCEKNLREHEKMHISYRYERGFIPYGDSKRYMVPKSQRDEDVKLLTDEAAISFSIPDSYKCKECDMNIYTEIHFKELMYCNKGDCKYQTRCRSSMTTHKALCATLARKVYSHPLDFELFCVCGFSNMDGNQMAQHLALCERKSAYPTKEEAHKAAITPGMLDVLGLIRKMNESKDGEEGCGGKGKKRSGRKWRRVIELAGSDNDSNDPDDPDHLVSDEDVRIKPKKRRITDDNSPEPEVSQISSENTAVDAISGQGRELSVHNLPANFDSLQDTVEAGDVAAQVPPTGLQPLMVAMETADIASLSNM